MGWIDLGLTRDAVAWPEAESYRHFMVSRPDDGKLTTPWWDPVVGVQQWDAGDYWFCATVRVPGGSAFGRLTRFTVAPDDTTIVCLPADLGAGGWDPSSLVKAELEESLFEFWPEVASNLPETGLFFIFEPGEPATRMIPVLGKLRQRLNARAVEVIPVMKSGAEATWLSQLTEAGLPGRVYQDIGGQLFDWLAGPADHGPVVMLILPGINEGRPVLLRSGLDNGIDFSVHLALDLFAEED